MAFLIRSANNYEVDLMPIDNYPRRDMVHRLRACDSPKLLAWPTANGATALPMILDEATYTPLATLKPNDAPVLLGNGIYGYRPGADEKMLGLEFCSVAGADGQTQVWEVGMYSMPYVKAVGSSQSANTYTGWKRIGTANFTMTLGSLALASQTTDPFVNSQTFSSSTIEWADTYAETDNDFNNSTAGFYRFFPMGYGALNKSGLVVADLSFATLLAIRLVTKAASSTQELIGLHTEIN